MVYSHYFYRTIREHLLSCWKTTLLISIYFHFFVDFHGISVYNCMYYEKQKTNYIILYNFRLDYLVWILPVEWTTCFGGCIMVEALLILFVLTVIGLLVGLWFALIVGFIRLAWRYAPQLIFIAVIFTIAYMVVA